MPEHRDIAEKLVKKLQDPDLPKDHTVDDFFDEMGITPEDRTELTFSAVMRQAFEVAHEREGLSC